MTRRVDAKKKKKETEWIYFLKWKRAVQKWSSIPFQWKSICRRLKKKFHIQKSLCDFSSASSWAQDIHFVDDYGPEIRQCTGFEFSVFLLISSSRSFLHCFAFSVSPSLSSPFLFFSLALIRSFLSRLVVSLLTLFSFSSFDCRSVCAPSFSFPLPAFLSLFFFPLLFLFSFLFSFPFALFSFCCSVVCWLSQYVLVLDTLNFCFWPLIVDTNTTILLLPWSMFSHMTDPVFSTDRAFAVLTDQICKIGWRAFLLVSPQHLWSFLFFRASVRLLREIGIVLRDSFHGLGVLSSFEQRTQCSSACSSCYCFLSWILWSRCVCNSSIICSSVLFLKRAQIFVGDLWGAFGGRGLGSFMTLMINLFSQIIEFPQLLRSLGMPDDLSSPPDPDRNEQEGKNQVTKARNRERYVWYVSIWK